MHFEVTLPSAIENGARRSTHWETEIVKTDGGNEVRNSRWSIPLRLWEISFNNADLTNADHEAVEDLYNATEGGTHTFNFNDERSGELVKVRFDSELTFTNTVGPFHRIETFTIQEVRE